MTEEKNDRKASAPFMQDEGTLLALERNLLAAERTLMAWIRTSLSMISFGFTIAKFFEYLAATQQRTFRGPLGRTWGPGTVGLTLISIGVFALVFAVIEHRNTIVRLRDKGLKKGFGLAFIVATLLSLLGVFAFIVVLTS